MKKIEATGVKKNTAEFGKGEILLVAKNLHKSYELGAANGNIFRKEKFLALHDVNLDIRRGEILALVGESGSGKSTLARILLGIEKADSGKISWRVSAAENLAFPAMMIFQNPGGSLNPRMNIFASLREALRQVGKPSHEYHDRALTALSEVGLDAELGRRYPHELSGGQLQRVAIARALLLKPLLLLADEAVSALDVSIQSSILNLLADIRTRKDMSILFITHDLAVASYLADRIAVMCAGKILECAPAEKLLSSPKSDYTKSLLAAAPSF